MARWLALALLAASAVLEAAGDALVRKGLHAVAPWTRGGFLAAGAVVLFAYGLLVNAPPWDFGRLLGVYVALFFVVAQVIAFAAFGVVPTRAVVAGGVLIVGGGLIVASGGG